MNQLILDDDFLIWFKRQTEAKWQKSVIKRNIYGFQIQAGTRWNPGLHENQICEYERAVAARFPDDFRRLLRNMNGTDLPTLNVYGYCGEPHRTSQGVYSYPTDLECVTSWIEEAKRDRFEIAAVLRDEGYVLDAATALVPFYGHRFIACGPDPKECVVLSICGSDAIVYGMTLRVYLEAEFLGM